MNLNLSFDERVMKAELYLNDTEDEIIKYLKKNRQNLQSLSIQKIATELYIAPNSIMRLSKKLGYSGFAELKFAVANELKPQNKTLSGQLMELLPNNIVRTLDIIDINQITLVASIIKKAKCCIFAGVGDSIYFCELLGKNMRCVDSNVKYFQQIHDMIYSVEHGSKDDVLVIISAQGENERLIDLAKKAKAKGMKVISITHMNDNRLAQEANYNLFFWGEYRSVQGYNVTDRTGLMLLVRLLSEAFWRNDE